MEGVMTGRGKAEFRGILGARLLVWHSPLNSGFLLLNIVHLKERLPYIAPAKIGLLRVS